MSEFIPSEILTEEFNPLLYETRSLLYGVQQHDVVGQFKVTEHTDNRTVMTVGDPRESILHFVMEDIQQGVLARSLKSYATADGMVTQDNTILLSTPWTSRMLSTTHHTESKAMSRPVHDSNSLIDQIANNSTPLTHEVAEQWYSEIHELLQHKPEQLSGPRASTPETSAPFSRLFRRHVSRV